MALDAFPIFLRLEGRNCLVVGGGVVAARKAALLLRAGARLMIVAPSLSPDLAALASAGRVAHVARFESALVEGKSLVFVASEDETLAREVSAAAGRAGVPVNVVDRPALSSFVSGALVDRAPVLVAISTGGAAPVLARELRLAIERLLPTRLGALARFAERFRGAVRASLPNAVLRRRFWQGFFEGPVATRVLAGDEAGAQGAMLALVNRPAEESRGQGAIHILSLGTNEADLLTLRAQRLLGEADAIVHDASVAAEILDAGRRDADRIALEDGNAESSALLYGLARGGKRVVRLIASAGPAAAAECGALRARGVPAYLVPGVAASDATADVDHAWPRADAVSA